jgi:trypsin
MGDAEVSMRIAGGRVVNPSFKYPFIVSLWFNGIPGCGGTMISPNKIMTAAHCTVGSIKKWTAKIHRQDLTKTDADEKGMTFQIISRRFHPQFNNNTNENDVAVWTIWGKVNLPYYPQLDDGNGASSVGSYLNVIGWGSEYARGPESSQLQEVYVPIVDQQTCQKDYNAPKYQYINPELHVCAGYSEGKRDACTGDSGGPAFIETPSGANIVGVTSYGRGCALPDSPGVYTRVAGVKSWVLSQ